jgi:hypothetical protein
MPDAPPKESLHTPELRNRWGTITKEERIPYLQKWWQILPKVLPYEEWRTAWQKVVPAAPPADSRKAITAWLFKAEKAICQKLEKDRPHNSYAELCSELQTYESGCGRNRTRKMKTCRSLKAKSKSTLKNRRERLYKATGGYL